MTSTTTTATADDADEEADPSVAWKELHEKIHSTITELDGSVVPKLNWSAPKDATWIAATNSMECQVPNDIYLLLKGSDFITHDLDHAFDDCEDQSHSESQGEVQVESEDRYEVQNAMSVTDCSFEFTSRNLSSSGLRAETFPYCLVLRKTIPAMITSLEFRCFVNARHLLCLCQRELNYYEFLTPLVPKLLPLIQTFFDKNLRDTFPDEDFVFDIYIPPPHVRVWLIDINPWAPRTDPLLFSWLEVFEMAEDVKQLTNPESESEDDDENQSSEAEYAGSPEFRLVGRNDPEALNFNTAQYSAHKLPKDVVDAGIEGEAGIRDFMVRWREIVNQERQADTG